MSTSSTFNYICPPSLTDLFLAEKRLNLVIGPVGSGKTTACIMYILKKIMEQKAVQRASGEWVAETRGVIARNTLGQIKTTVLRDIRELLGPLITERVADNMFYINLPPTPERPWRVKCEVFLIPLAEVQDQRRLLSLQLSWLWVNEAREVPFDVILAANGRLGRFPARRNGGCTFPFLLLDTNPPALGSELWRLAEVERPPNLNFIHQPGARTGKADWMQHLPDGYYDDLSLGATGEWVRVHVDGEYSRDPSGEPVVGHVFDRNVHVRGLVAPIPGLHLVVGMDPGLCPAALITQHAPNGQIRVLGECSCLGVGTDVFLEDHLMPALHRLGVAGWRMILIMDPWGKAGSAAVGRNQPSSPYNIAKSKGLDVRIPGTNESRARINAIESMLVGRLGTGDPKVLVDSRCTVLIDALGSMWHYKKGKISGQLSPEPDKNHPYSDVADAFGYVCIGIMGNMRHMDPNRGRSLSGPSLGRGASGGGAGNSLGWT